MNWKVDQNNLHLSKVLRVTSKEPQAARGSSCTVGKVIGTRETEAFRDDRNSFQNPEQTLPEEFEVLRALAIEAGLEDGIPFEPRRGNDRPNAFLEMLDDEYPNSENKASKL